MLEKDFRFNLEEAAGAVGDYGTLIPIIIGAAAVTELNLSSIIFFFAVSYILTGLYYKLPMPVEPMKAIGAIAISGSLSAPEIAGAGLITGLIFLFIGLIDGIKYIKKYIPQWLIRGIQFGLALTLIRTAFSMISNNFLLGAAAAAVIIIFYFTSLPNISSLLVFILGLGVGIYFNGLPPLVNFNWPVFSLPMPKAIWSGFIKGTVPQITLTLGNAVLATSLLINDLLDRKVSERKIVSSIGLMCVIPSLFGGFPMCHGAGGLAAQYRFGARTGGSNIISGIILLIIAFFFASQEIINIIPFSILGALLFFSAIQLLKSAAKTENKIYTGITGIGALFLGMANAFLIMLVFHIFNSYILKNKQL